MARHMDWVFLVASLLIILVAAELFTNGIEWVGEGFGLSEGAVGSVLAAIGTALPETLLPIVAIVSGHEAGDEIGIGGQVFEERLRVHRPRLRGSGDVTRRAISERRPDRWVASARLIGCETLAPLRAWPATWIGSSWSLLS